MISPIRSLPRLLNRYQNQFTLLLVLFLISNSVFFLLYQKSTKKDGKIVENLPSYLKAGENGTFYLPDGIVLTNGRTEKIKQYMKELNLTDPGAAGTPTYPDEKLLTPEHRRLIQAGYDDYGCNTFVSDMVGFNRIITPIQSQYCREKKYDTSNFPKVSIVIAFHNDPYSGKRNFIQFFYHSTNMHF